MSNFLFKARNICLKSKKEYRINDDALQQGFKNESVDIPLSLYFVLSFSVIVAFKFCKCLLHFCQMSLTLIVNVSEKKISVYSKHPCVKRSLALYPLHKILGIVFLKIP